MTKGSPALFCYRINYYEHDDGAAVDDADKNLRLPGSGAHGPAALVQVLSCVNMPADDVRGQGFKDL